MTHKLSSCFRYDRNRLRLGTWLSAGLALSTLLVARAEALERRVAFVVGNSAYASVPNLPNPKNDAAAVAESLRASGFEVISAVDLGQAEFESEFQRFIRSLSGADISMFYYSGHGIQVGGDNRIIPIDAKLKSAQDMEVETVSVETIMSYMQANSRSQLVYLDSCRNNPFPSSSFLVGADKEVPLSSVGLAAQEASLGSLIAFSTQPGNVAVDGTGDRSPFTDSMLKHSFKLGVDVQTALMQVTQEVWEATNKKQRPWSSSTLVEPIFLALPSIIIAADEQQDDSSTTPTIIISSNDDNAGGDPAVTKPEPAPEDPGASQSSTVQIAGLIGDVFQKPQQVPIGVGAVAMLDDLPILRGSSSVRVELNKVPEKGVLYLDEKPLIAGSVIDHESLKKISFEPAIGSEGQTQTFELTVAQAGTESQSIKASVDPYLTGCDTLAGEPLDLQGVSPGVLPNEIKEADAIEACTVAMTQFPEVARYAYQLGRAKYAARDTSGARDLFDAAAKLGHVRAYYQLGHMAARGVGRPQDLEEANRLFKFGAEQGDPFAMVSYGRNLVRGRGVAKNRDEGIRWLNKAVELGHTYAMNELGSMYYYGRDVKENWKRGIRFYEAGLARNDIYSINNMAFAYAHGKGVKKDPGTALGLFQAASAGGHPSAPTNIGIMYYNGEGVKKDLAKAIEWYSLGAERGDPWGASNLGWIYAQGPKSVRDLEKAVYYSSMARALDFFNENPKAGAELPALPVRAKTRVIKQLIAELGNSDLETASDIDGTLVLLSRKVWQKRNPRYDLF